MNIKTFLIIIVSLTNLLSCNETIRPTTTVGNPTGNPPAGNPTDNPTDDPTDNPADSPTGKPDDKALYYDAAQLVAPSFAPVVTSSSSQQALVSGSWETGNPLYETFYLFREFNPDTDQGVIDTANLYKTLWESRGFFSNTKENCSVISEQVISPPFDFGNAQTTYNCAYNEESSTGYDFGGAYKELDEDGNIIEVASEAEDESAEGESEATPAVEATVKDGLFGFVWAGSHNEYGTLQGSYNTSTNDLSIDIAVWVDYERQNDYCYRNDIGGNAGTHLFAVRSIKGNKVPGFSYLSVAGKGYSEGEGKHFLLKIAHSGLATARYYCIGAGDGETELRAMDPEGSATVDANCEEFHAAVDATTLFTTNDLACASSDFNPGGTGMAAEGTIFLNFR